MPRFLKPFYTSSQRGVLLGSLLLLGMNPWARGNEATPEPSSTITAPDFSPKSPTEEDPANSLFSPPPDLGPPPPLPIVRGPDDPRKLQLEFGITRSLWQNYFSTSGSGYFIKPEIRILTPLPKLTSGDQVRVGMGYGRLYWEGLSSQDSSRSIDAFEAPFDLSVTPQLRIGFTPSFLVNRFDEKIGLSFEFKTAYALSSPQNKKAENGFNHFSLAGSMGYRSHELKNSVDLSGFFFSVGIQAEFSKILNWAK
jgi:hypothetical protein